MKVLKETITTTVYTTKASELFNTTQIKELADKYNLSKNTLSNTNIEIVAEPVVSSGEPIIEFWGGLNGYGDRFSICGIPQRFFINENFDIYVKEVIFSCLYELLIA